MNANAIGNGTIAAFDAWRVRVPLAEPYHLSKVYGTLTHANAVLVRLTLDDGTQGWGEADPGGLAFTGDDAGMVMEQARAVGESLTGVSPAKWIDEQRRERRHGSLVAAIDVACHDALARARGIPVWRLLGELKRDRIDVLWPTSSGGAGGDLDTIDVRAPLGFTTFMLKMGDRDIADEISRLREVLRVTPDAVRVMVDANQGWRLDEALAFVEGAADLPLILVEQPVAATDLDGLHSVRERARCPVSVDESLQCPADARAIVEAGAADVFSVKISKNGGLANAAYIAGVAADAAKRVLMNSMIELGITQAASLHLGCTLDNLLDCGHAYMSTLRMGDDVTDFSTWINHGTACLPAERPGLGIEIDYDKIAAYEVDSCHAG
ncbi:MAG: hypothetical protein DWQ08_10840 [Proteobacteria bacterium]|nr:MAG: hypothetical protein DWQ08_10840 [Pseudomonadota bacterium]